MRLWHEEIIPLLPKNQLLGQHRECCALRGNGWGKKHKVEALSGDVTVTNQKLELKDLIFQI